MRFIILTILLSGILATSYAETDSLIIKGRIQNLSGRLYRQASFINFSRNNILQPQSELSKQAPLEPDGSFRLSLPMLFSQEEIYLDYGGRAFATFLGSPGTVEITFNGDSIGKAKKLFFFAGVNADANNQYPLYVDAENKIAESNKAVASSLISNSKDLLGPNFFKSFWQRGTPEAKSLVKSREQLRLSALQNISQNAMLSPVLFQWVKSITDEEGLQLMYEHAMGTDYVVPKDLLDSLEKLKNPPLTGQRVIWANRFGNYADIIVGNRKISNPARVNSLPVRLMSTLIRNNAVNLTPDERQHLDNITANGLTEKGELDFMNKLFAKNEMVLNLLFNFERENRIYGEVFDSTATEFLKVRYLAKNMYKFTYPQQLVLNKYIQSRTGLPQFRQSLDEIVALEVRDSADIRKIINFKDVRTDPAEALPGYWLAASNDRGTSWFNRVLDTYKGKTVYLAKWNIEDPKSREELDFIPALQASLPEDVVFLYVHLADEENNTSEQLLRQYIVRHKLKGTHLFLNNDQVMDMLFRLNPLDTGTFALIRPNGKFAMKNASPPSAREKTVQAILQAGN
ncbi:hypothetical protein [Dyadobacter luticola]|uniref:Thioredoxin domain-containing protein n=1 Tax=Dyadobacter luticola TaxID=1979387 RepID=A0A5R9KT29_9BACT|nr:hypothetical protein [Dyadobacter luticola]TLU99431.1 hypothetical protein FEN17_23010 [Dyadobacter luticola]